MVSGIVVGGGTVSPHHKYVAVTLLTDETLTFAAEVKTRVGEVYSQTCSYLQQLGMQDTDLFGLVTTIDGENVFADPDSKLSKYGPKSWKTSPNGLDSSGEPLLQFKFRVQFYVETHLLLRDGLSRLHYYLQLRENVLLYQQPLTEEAAFLLASHALQADLGDFSEDQHHGHYFDPALYFPSWMVERVGAGYLMEHASHMHRDNLGLTQAEAQAQYIREASQQEAPHNLHLYRLRYKKQDPTPSVVTAICARGLDIYEEEAGAPLHTSRKLLSTFQWSTIGKLSFEAKQQQQQQQSETAKSVEPIMCPVPGGTMPQPPQQFMGFQHTQLGADTLAAPPASIAGSRAGMSEGADPGPPVKGPLPPEHQVIQDVINEIRNRCLQVVQNQQMKQRIEDIGTRMELLYDKLRAGQLSPTSVSGVHRIVSHVQNADYHGALTVHAETIAKGSFAELSCFMPPLKQLLQYCMQLQVFLQ